MTAPKSARRTAAAAAPPASRGGATAQQQTTTQHPHTGANPAVGHRAPPHPVPPAVGHGSTGATGPHQQTHDAAALAAAAAVRGSATPSSQSITVTLRGLIVLVAWNTLLFTRFFLVPDGAVPIEALLPVAYVAGSLFIRHDELRLFRPTLLQDAAAMAVLSFLIFDVPVAEVLLRAVLVLDALQWCQLPATAAVTVAVSYLAFFTLVGSVSLEPRSPLIAFAVHVTMGLGVAFALRTNRVLLGVRAFTQDAAERAAAGAASCASAVPGASSLGRHVRGGAHRVATAPLVTETLAWACVMAVDWALEISLGGLAITACLLVGFGASLAHERVGASNKPRYVYQLLLVVAVWISDLCVAFTAPAKTLPFLANAVISAYFVLHCAAPTFSVPKVTSRESNTLEITPVAPHQASTLLPAMVWIVMVGIDLYVQLHGTWREPTVGRTLLSVNTVGYGALMLTSTFLDSFSRDARIRARMQYLEDEAVSPDTVALRQICDDLEGTRELASALASAGIDLRDLVTDNGSTTAVFTSHPDQQQSPSEAGPAPIAGATGAPVQATPPTASTPLPDATQGAPHADPTVPDPAETESSGAVSDASTTAHNAAAVAAAAAQRAHGDGSSRPTPTDGSRAPSEVGETTGLGDDAELGEGGSAVSKDPAADAGTSAAADREQERRERKAQEEAKRKAKQQQRLEAQRAESQRQAELKEARARHKREQDVSDLFDGERRARDSIASKERNARDKAHQAHVADAKAITVALRTRREREERARKVAEAAEAEKREKVQAQRRQLQQQQQQQHQQSAEGDGADAAGGDSSAMKGKPTAATGSPPAPTTTAGVKASAPAGLPSKPSVPLPRSATAGSAAQTTVNRSTTPKPVPKPSAAPVAPSVTAAKGPPGAVVAGSTASKGPGAVSASKPEGNAAVAVDRKVPAKPTPPEPRTAKAQSQTTSATRPVVPGTGGLPAPASKAAVKAASTARGADARAAPAAQPPVEKKTSATNEDQANDGSELIGRLLASLKSPSAASVGSTGGDSSAGASDAFVRVTDPPPATAAPSAPPAPAQQRPAARGDDEDDDTAWDLISHQVQTVLDENAMAADAGAAGADAQKTFGDARTASSASFHTPAHLVDPGSFTVAASSGHQSPAPSPYAAAQAAQPALAVAQPFMAAAVPTHQMVQPQPAVLAQPQPQPAYHQYYQMPDGTTVLVQTDATQPQAFVYPQYYAPTQ